LFFLFFWERPTSQEINSLSSVASVSEVLGDDKPESETIDSEDKIEPEVASENKICENNECPDCQYCEDGECLDYCSESDNDCGCNFCIDCNEFDGCSGTNYLDYYCDEEYCSYISKDCTDCSCSCGGYDALESKNNNNCSDSKDNDRDGFIDLDDVGCGESKSWHKVEEFEGVGEATTGSFYIEGKRWKISWDALLEEGALSSDSSSLIAIEVRSKKGEERNPVEVFSRAGENFVESGSTYIEVGEQDFYLKIATIEVDHWDIAVYSYH